jgi:GNAT superfamily N-acetyltransferase
VDIHDIDVHDDAQFHDFYVNTRDALLYQRPHAPLWSEREASVMFRHEEPTEEGHAIAAYDDGRLVGGAELFFPLMDNRHMAYAEVHVAPQNRRQGVGSAVLEHVVDRVRSRGRTVLLAEANLPLDERESHPYTQFARKHGFALASVEVRRDLRLPVPASRIAAWERQAEPHHAGYHLETFVDSLPEQFVESYCALTNRLSIDAPTGDIEFEPEGMTPHALRVREQKLKEQGRTMLETLGLDKAGRVVAQTTLAVPSDNPEVALQWGTIVLPEHRGHRLGMAVKARNLRELQAAFPGRSRVVTTNSEANAHMLAINIAMGFEPVELSVEFQRKL